ncbi:MAG: sigma-70 family RNA polymerase sigma factor [Phycisphaerales bacterium]
MSPTLQLLAPLPDEEVVARVLCGDTAVFELLMRRHNQRLFRLARAVVRDGHEAEDIVQEAYVRAYAGLRRFEGRSSVATWLSRITLHEALRRRRRRGRARVADGIDPGSLTGPAAPGAADGELGDVLTGAIDALPMVLRAVVMLRLVEGLGTRETAACLRLTETNVKVSLHRARQMLQGLVGDWSEADARGRFAFDGERCDRIVAEVFRRLR